MACLPSVQRFSHASSSGSPGYRSGLGVDTPILLRRQRGEVSPKSLGEVSFSSRSVAMTCILAPLCAGGKDAGLKPSGGDVLKPRERPSVIFSGDSYEIGRAHV